ncbi:TIGR03618 family F420-dependent PPOX class oxidoreductase [Streptomyces sp. NPDC060194]|uniref:TIGR03618 family F420-dependent PPOX class oxidoreductase n=1 Tax=Streptomyces sp. NPDC060194 TaxID=3347069 RepID=UPI0036630A32
MTSSKTPKTSDPAFWRERHLCTVTTIRPNGRPHVVPVGVTYDPAEGVARIITSGTTRKVANIRAAGPAGAPVAVCQVDRARWATLEGVATVNTDPAAIADAERRYEERYGRTPRVNPARVVVEIAVDRVLGNT